MKSLIMLKLALYNSVDLNPLKGFIYNLIFISPVRAGNNSKLQADRMGYAL